MDGPKIRVKLTIRLKELIADNAEQVDTPMVVVKSKATKDGEYEEIGRTEPIKKKVEKEDVLEFMTKTVVDYHFESKTYMQFNLMQYPGGATDGEPKPVSWLECTVGQIVSARGKMYDKPLAGRIDGGVYGSMVVFAEEIKGREDESIQLTFKGENILNKDGLMNKSDPYLVMKRTRDDGTVEELHKTEYIKNTETPEWQMFEEPLLKLCNGDLRARILVEVWDQDQMSKDDQIGFVETSVQELLEVPKLQLIDYKEGRNLDPGQLVIVKAQLLPLVRSPSLLDYVQGGMEITLSVAVDFTASNAAAKNPRSLHYCHGDGPNDYQKALESVGEVLLEYDSDKKVEALGFGGHPKGSRKCSHCFGLAGEECEVEGMPGLMAAYLHAVRTVRFSGPTNVHEVIQKAEAKARAKGDENYHVLLIITDGAISDKQETAAAIVAASDAPLSIIIVGVGKANFGKMKKLDGDDATLKDSKGRRADRDIVQFVPMREFEGNAHELAKAVLKELPGQVLAHMCKKQIKPKSGWNFQLPDNDWAAESDSRAISLEADPTGIFGFLAAEPDPEEEALELEEPEEA